MNKYNNLRFSLQDTKDLETQINREIARKARLDLEKTVKEDTRRAIEESFDRPPVGWESVSIKP